MTILIVCGVNEAGTREVLAVEPLLEESRKTYAALRKAEEAGLQPPSLVIFDAHAGLAADKYEYSVYLHGRL